MNVSSILATAGITYLVTGSKLLGAAVDAEGHSIAPARPILERWWFTRSLTSCSFCTGFWVALAVARGLHDPLWASAHLLGAGGAGVMLSVLLRQSPTGWGAVGVVAGIFGTAVFGLVWGPPSAVMGAVLDAAGTAFAVMVLHDLRDAALRHCT